MTKDTLTMQGNLFDREPTEEDRLKDFLKSLFHTIERMWDFDLIEESFREYEIQREMEADAERFADEDDF